uniref:Uncharacterized protein LOC104225878 n=1 Tax=Nicotiana sylvestris TaxID=4096 RepID=A0A1U7W7S1_NICSY|nr:PREDICTED: uncharacterized protein LOC104225878 [Nicotiana sylvestris]
MTSEDEIYRGKVNDEDAWLIKDFYGPYFFASHDLTSWTSEFEYGSKGWYWDEYSRLVDSAKRRCLLTTVMKDWSKERDELAQKSDNFGLVVHNLDSDLSAKVDACNAQQFNDELYEAEKNLLDQIEELKQEYQSLDHIFLEDVHVKKSALESSRSMVSQPHSGGVTDVTGLGDLPVPRKVQSSGVTRSSSSPKLVDQFLAPSVNPDCRWLITFFVLEDARIFSVPVGVASYLRCLVTEEDQAMMDAMEVPCLFNYGQHALNRDSVLHHEAFLQIREQLSQHEVEVRELNEKRDIYKLLSEKLQAKLEAARSEHAEMAEQVQYRFEQIGQLQVKKIEELQSQLDLTISDKSNLANEIESAKSEVTVANTKADAKVAQFKVDVEAIQVQDKKMVDHVRWKARRKAIVGVHAQDFDILTEIENVKAEEAKAQMLAFPKEDSESLR